MNSIEEYRDHLYRYLSAAKLWPDLHTLVPEPEPPTGLDGAIASRIKQELVYDMNRSSEAPAVPAQPKSDHLRVRICGWFKRRLSTKWSDKEMRALKLVYKDLDQEDLAAVDAYYSASIDQSKDYRRRDVVTLLNNWAGEVDRARRWASEQQQQAPAKPSGEPLWKRVKTLEQAIAQHPANHNSMTYNPLHSHEQHQDFLSKWQELARLKQQANA
jgi:hypothetical protein